MRWRAARARPEAEICGTRRCPRAGTGLQRPRTSSLDMWAEGLESGPVLYNTIILVTFGTSEHSALDPVLILVPPAHEEPRAVPVYGEDSPVRAAVDVHQAQHDLPLAVLRGHHRQPRPVRGRGGRRARLDVGHLFLWRYKDGSGFFKFSVSVN